MHTYEGIVQFCRERYSSTVPTLNCLDYLEGCCSLAVQCVTVIHVHVYVL